MDVVQRAGSATTGQARGLLLAAIGDETGDPLRADAVLRAADSLGVDALDYCAQTLGHGDAALERAAHWAGFGFSRVVPARLASGEQMHRLDHLAGVRTWRADLFGRTVTFCAPRFADLMRLAEARLNNPDLSRRLCIVPGHAIRATLAAQYAGRLLAEARQRLTRRWPMASANVDLPMSLRAGFVTAFGVVTVAAALGPVVLGDLLLPFIAVLLLIPACLRIAAVFATVPRTPPVRLLADAELPTYTVLVPLRDEAEMVPLLERALLGLDYPAEKLDVKFVVEDKSIETIAAVTALLGDLRFELVRVPDAPPHTKPKALNFALPLARGEHIVVFDAEDIPDVEQLRLAASVFAADPGLDCIQAELVVDNAEENWITAMFAGEYAGQFGLLLPLFARLRLPMPLGGTSNHFRMSALRELGHWDAYNVTEDADLGVRLSRLRYRTGMLESDTYEEAPITLGAWMAQRTRWIKGWMQTFIVHNRNPRRFIADIGWRNFIFFQVYVGSLIVSSLLHTVFLMSLVLRGLFDQWPRLDHPVDLAYVLVLVVGYGATFLLVLAGLVRRRAWHLMPQQLMLPFYWMMHSVAALRAAHQLLVRPYFWGKTAHGRTRRPRSFVR